MMRLVSSTNQQAIEQLQNGNFLAAQKLFYLNKKKSPSFQTYNNLGVFLYKNGMETKTGKIICATAIGEKYLWKGLQDKRDFVILENLGRVSYEKADFLSAENLFSEAYSYHRDINTLYHLASAQFLLKKYALSIRALESIKNKKTVFLFEYLFALLPSHIKRVQEILLREKNVLYEASPLDLMQLLYCCKQYDELLTLCEKCIHSWSFGDLEWAMCVDVFSKFGKLSDIKILLASVFNANDMTAFEKKLYRQIQRFIKDEEYRLQYIQENAHYFPPLLEDMTFFES